MINDKKKVLVALSGGVDSSVAASLLKSEGHELMAVTLKTFCYQGTDASPKACCGLEGVNSARAVAAQLGIPHIVLDVAATFQDEVINDFINEYANGRTPNPCVRCNATVKIPFLLDKARSYGCTHLATGHYARVIEHDKDQWALHRGLDVKKDQAYFLWEIPPRVLPYLMLPVGDFSKEQIREKAAEINLVNAQKAESQEICFVPDGDYVNFLSQQLPADHPGFQPGKILDTQGQLIGQHQGYLGYTVGQRKGIGGGHGERLYVAAIDPEKRLVIAGVRSALHSDEVCVEKINIFCSELNTFKDLRVQIRHRAEEVPCHISAQSAERIVLKLDKSVYAVTPGQSAVVFSGDRLLFGGTIVLNKNYEL